MGNLHEIILIDRNAFTRGLLVNFFSQPRFRNRIGSLEEFTRFDLLTNEKIKTFNPEFIVFNFQTCVQNIEKHISLTTKINPNISLIACYFSGSQFEIDLLLRAGVNAIIGNNQDPVCILNAMDTLAIHKHYINDLVDNHALTRAKRKIWIEGDSLTIFEFTVMRLISIGLSRINVAKLLSKEKHTIENAISIIHAKTGTKNDLQISRYAILHGYIDSDLRYSVGSQTRIEEIESTKIYL